MKFVIPTKEESFLILDSSTVPLRFALRMTKAKLNKKE